MKEEILYKQLKEYLTKEYMRISDERDALIREKVQLEVEREKEENPLFENNDVEQIKKLFSPFSDDIFHSVLDDKKKKDELSIKITKIENNVSNYENWMEEIKGYISFVQIMESKEREKEDFLNTGNDTTEMVFATAEFLEEQYPGIRFVVDFVEDDYIAAVRLNSNMVGVLTYTLSSTIEATDINYVEIHLKKEKENMVLSVNMYYDDEMKSQYIHRYHLNRK